MGGGGGVWKESDSQTDTQLDTQLRERVVDEGGWGVGEPDRDGERARTLFCKEDNALLVGSTLKLMVKGEPSLGLSTNAPLASVTVNSTAVGLKSSSSSASSSSSLP